MFGHSGFDHIGSRFPTNLPVARPSPRHPGSHSTIINSNFLGEETMNKLYYPARTHLHDRDGRPTEFDQSQRDVSVGVIITRLLVVLVVVMVATSILGFTLFDRQGGNAGTAVLSLVIGCTAAVLGLIAGFRKAHQVS